MHIYAVFDELALFIEQALVQVLVLLNQMLQGAWAERCQSSRIFHQHVLRIHLVLLVVGKAEITRVATEHHLPPLGFDLLLLLLLQLHCICY